MATTPRKTTPRKTSKRPTEAELERRAQQAATAKGEQEIPLEHGVAVFTVNKGDGSYAFVVKPIGDTRVTEIGDILRYGLKAHENNLGQ